MIKRNAEKRIKDWIANGKDALLIEGARQTGKTYLVRECLNEYGDYVELNFIERPELIELFKTGTSANDIVMRLSVASGRTLLPGRTIIFLDEVQACSEIVTMIKFLVEEGSFRYIMSGSLLGIELKDLRSAPVGYMSTIKMYPLDIMEFMAAVGFPPDVFEMIQDCYEKKKEVDTFVHNRLIDAFYLYLIVGGMPEAAQVYLDTNDIMRVSEIHDKIIDLYKLDFAQYEQNNKLKLREIYDAVPSELEEKNKRFYINHLGNKAEYEKYSDDFLWLKNAGVVLPVYNAKELRLPLMMSEKRNLFKLFMSDIGLLTSRYSNQVKYQILQKDKNIKNGGLFENVVAQELAAHGVKTWYYNSKKLGELDLVIESEGHVLPIEVKSGKDYKKHNALNNVLANDAYDAERALVLYNGNLVCKENITYMPIYMASCIRDNKPESMIYSLRWTE